jgi:hypothetical protein
MPSRAVSVGGIKCRGISAAMLSSTATVMCWALAENLDGDSAGFAWRPVLGISMKKHGRNADR